MLSHLYLRTPSAIALSIITIMLCNSEDQHSAFVVDTRGQSYSASTIFLHRPQLSPPPLSMPNQMAAFDNTDKSRSVACHKDLLAILVYNTHPERLSSLINYGNAASRALVQYPTIQLQENTEGHRFLKRFLLPCSKQG